MKIYPILIAITTSLLFASSVAVAESNHERTEGHEWSQHITVAPEISVASGTSAIALLVGVLLLAGEKSRTRRS
jgi:hypothetical protein